jgi:hypothetical protein
MLLLLQPFPQPLLLLLLLPLLLPLLAAATQPTCLPGSASILLLLVFCI